MGNSVNLTEWAVVRASGGSYLGKIHTEVPHPAESYKQLFLSLMSAGKPVQLNPCFDFMAPLRPVQNPQTGQVAMQRDPVIIPFDFTSGQAPVYLLATSVMFCGDLEGKDAELYAGFVSQAMDLQMHIRAQAAGIQLASPMPSGKLHV